MQLDRSIDFESIIFSYIEEFKFLFFPDQWGGLFADYSKNEILILLFLYRYNTANMTELSEFINAPLNTSTGVVGRLEKKEMAERVRSTEDRRVVQIVLTGKAKEIIDKEKEIIEHYFKEIYEMLTDDEKNTARSIIKKVVEVLHKGINNPKGEDTEIKKVRRIIVE